jgi:hypothetical protein
VDAVQHHLFFFRFFDESARSGNGAHTKAPPRDDSSEGISARESRKKKQESKMLLNSQSDLADSSGNKRTITNGCGRVGHLSNENVEHANVGEAGEDDQPDHCEDLWTEEKRVGKRLRRIES